MWYELSNISVEDKQACFDNLTEYIEKLRTEPELRNLFIEVTINCNEHCIHCGSNCGDIIAENTLTDNEILRMLVDLRNDLANAGKPLPFITITGGEPLVRPGILELMKKIHMLGYSWGMTSNGTLITPEVAKGLKEAGMFSIGLSLDGMRDTHEWFRQSKGSFETTLAGLDNLVREGFEHIMVTSVVHKRNINELDDLYALVKEHKITEWRITNIEPIGRALTNTELALTPDDYKYMIDYIIEKQADPDLNMWFTCNHYVGLKREYKVRPWFYFCRAGLQVASVQYNGIIGPCLDIERRKDQEYGNVRTDRILDVWENKFDVFRIHKEEKSSKCSVCEHKKNCMGGGYHTWNFDTNEPRICMLEMLGDKPIN